MRRPKKFWNRRRFQEMRFPKNRFWFCAAGSQPSLREKILEQATVFAGGFLRPIAKSLNQSDFRG